MSDPEAHTAAAPAGAGALAIPPALREELDEAAGHPEIVVLEAPSPEVLEAYALEERLGVIAVLEGTEAERAAALDAGALEVVDPRAPLEARARIRTAVARFRSRLRLEASRDEIDRQAELVERDLRLAARLQRSFLPRGWPPAPGVAFAAAWLPREYVSGDSYDVRQVAPGLLGLYTLDAMGHGVRAALLTVLLREAFQPLGPDGRPRPPGEVLGLLDERLREADLDESPTAACCYALLDLAARTLTIANAGHPLPLRVRADGAVEALGESGMLLGVLPERYESTVVALAPGDRVFLFTDGADDAYGARLGEALARHRDLELMDMIGGALGATVALDDEGRPDDDTTVLAFEVAAPPPGAPAEPREGPPA